MRLSSLPTSVQTLHEWMQENAGKWQKRQFCNDGFTSIHSMPDWNLSIRAPEGPETILKGQELTSSFAASISWLKSHEHTFEQTDGHDGHVCLIWPWLQVQPYLTLLKLARPACRRTRKHVDYGWFAHRLRFSMCVQMASLMSSADFFLRIGCCHFQLSLLEFPNVSNLRISCRQAEVPSLA